MRKKERKKEIGTNKEKWEEWKKQKRTLINK